MSTPLKVYTQTEYNTGTVVTTDSNTNTFNPSSPIGSVPGSALVTLPGSSTGVAYNQHTFVNPNTGTLWVTVEVDFSNLVMTNNDSFNFIHPRGILSTSVMFRVYIYKISGIHYLRLIHYSDGGVLVGQEYIPITLKTYRLDFELVRSSSISSNDANIKFWLDHIGVYNKTGFINYTAFPLINVLRLGAAAELDVGTNGSFRYGEVTVKDEPYVAQASPYQITVPKQPFISDGVVVTYKGTPNTCTYWEVVGVNNIIEGAAVGSIIQPILMTDGNGYAVNQYIASTNPADAGKTERIKVREGA